MTWFQFPLIVTQNSKSKAASFTFKIERNCKRKRAMTPPVKRCGVLSEPTSVTET
jgi:hypothetical protein